MEHRQQRVVSAHARFEVDLFRIVCTWVTTLQDYRDCLPSQLCAYLGGLTPEQVDSLAEYVAESIASDAFQVQGDASFYPDISPMITCQVVLNLTELCEGFWATLAQAAVNPDGEPLIPPDVAEASAGVSQDVWEPLKRKLLHALDPDFRAYMEAETY